MPTTNPTPSAWSELLVGAAGNLIGGFGATLLWWTATLCSQRRQLRAAIQQKRTAITLEIAQIRVWLRLLKEQPERASTKLPARSSQVLAALVRLGPNLNGSLSLEPTLGELEHRLGIVEAAVTRVFAATTGIATAMRGNEGEVEATRRELLAEADKAIKALSEFENIALT